MKKITLAAICLFSITAFSQSNMIDVIFDGVPAKLNIETGEFVVSGAKSNTNNTLSNTSNTLISQENTHTVSKGETLYSISKKHGVAMAKIKSINALETNVLSVGQVLKINEIVSIPVKANKTHTVVKGETLYSVAKKNNILPEELKALNNLKNNTISIGQVLKTN